MGQNLLTYQEASELLHVPLGTLYALVSEKRIPHIRVGNRFVRFRYEDVMEWIEEKKVGVKRGRK